MKRHRKYRRSIPLVLNFVLAAWIGRGACIAQDSLEWNFCSPLDALGAANMEPASRSDGMLQGRTAWDPHFTLRVAPEGIDANRLKWLTVRMYSSGEADVLDVYYESPDGRWCLGGKLPIAKGWATYRMDLTRNSWRETRADEASRQWGGPSKRVRTLRLDPGNQADRWIAIDYVRLAAEKPGDTEGVQREPRGRVSMRLENVPASVEAGGTLKFSLRCEMAAAGPLDAVTAFVHLRSGATILRLQQRKLEAGGQSPVAEIELPLSAYWNPGPLTLEAGCFEADLDGGPLSAPVRLANARAGTVKPPRCELRSLGGDAAIFVNDHPQAGFLFLTEGGLRSEYHREVAQSGVHLYSDWFGTSTESALGHVAPDQFDYGEFDRYFAAILDVDPQAYFLPHIGLTGPRWWQEAHPDELCKYENGTRGPTSFASRVWRQDIGSDLKKLIAYLRQTPYADRILGYIFYNGYTAEWQMWGTWQESRDDYSAPALAAFREFLRKKYPDDAALKAAWNDPGVTLAGAAMAGQAQRRPAGSRVLRDPSRERPAMDLYEFLNNMDADAVLDMARIVREATRGESLVGTYYAYLTAHGINQQDSGHLGARRVYDSPDIDFLMSPPNYWYRRPREACTFMSATDSMRLRGKLWLDESDHRTHLSAPDSGYGRADTLAETRGVFWREFAEVLTKRAAVSWFDMSGGWFSDPTVLADMGQANRIMQDSLPGRRPFQSEIAVLVDPDSFYWMRPTMANSSLVLNQVVTMPQSGAPWDFLVLSDLNSEKTPFYKLYIFLNAFCIDDRMTKVIHDRMRKNGATALFVYAPGYFAPDAGGSGIGDVSRIAALTGVQVAADEVEFKPQLQVVPGDPLSAGLNAGSRFGAEGMVSPRFYSVDKAARVAGRFPGTELAALVVKPMDGWTSVYCGAMQLPPALVRNIARSAGVHIWLDSDDALYTDGQFAGIHAATTGPKQLRLPQRRKVFNVRTGQAVPSDGTTVTVDVAEADTALLRLDP